MASFRLSLLLQLILVPPVRPIAAFKDVGGI